MGFGAMVCGFIVIFLTVESVDGEHFNPAETDFGVHTFLGMWCLVIGLIQVKPRLHSLSTFSLARK